MKKITFTLLLIFALNISIKAQDATIAKFKFEEAEAAYNNKKYQEALTKLDEVEKLLGKTYEKTLYLKIMALDKLLWSDPGNLDINKIALLQQNYTDYLKTFEGQTEEDKYRDIYKISEQYNKRGIPPAVVNSALAGSAEACYTLGRFYSGCDDDKRSFTFIKLSADKQYPKACVRMGAFYLGGYKIIDDNSSENVEIPKDAKKAMELFETASRQNDWEADVVLGYMYYFGIGVTKDKAKAEQYCKKVINNSARNYNQENDIGSYFMGVFYDRGVFVDKNYEQAMYWYKNVPIYSYYSYNADIRLKSLQKFYDNVIAGSRYFGQRYYSDAINNYLNAFEIIQDDALREKIALTYSYKADELTGSQSELEQMSGINAYFNAASFAKNKDNTINEKLEESLYRFYSMRANNKALGTEFSFPYGFAYMASFPEGKYIQTVKSELESQLYSYLKSKDKNYDKSMRYYLLRYIYLFPNGKYIEKAKVKLQKINSVGQETKTPFGITFEKYNGMESLLKNKFIIKSVNSENYYGKQQIKLVKYNQATYLTHVDGIPIDDLTLQDLNNLLVYPFGGCVLLKYKEVYESNLFLTRNIEL